MPRFQEVLDLSKCMEKEDDAKIKDSQDESINDYTNESEFRKLNYDIANAMKSRTLNIDYDASLNKRINEWNTKVNDSNNTSCNIMGGRRTKSKKQRKSKKQKKSRKQRKTRRTRK